MSAPPTTLPPPAPRASLRRRWTLVLLAAATLPLGLLSIATLEIQRRGLFQAEREQEVAVVDRVSDLLELDLDYAGEATRNVGRAMLARDAGTPDGRIALARDLMARVAPLQHIAIYDASGAFVDAIARVNESREPEPLPRVPEAYTQSPPGEEGAWLRAEYGAHGVVLRHLVALRDAPEGPVLAWAMGTLNPRWIDTSVANISTERYQHPDRVLVVDDHMRLLSRGPSQDLAVGQSLAGNDIFRVVNIPPQAFQSPYELTVNYAAGERMVGTFHTLPSRRWGVVVRRPEREAFAALQTARWLLLVGALVCAALAAAVGAWLARRTTRPIGGLMKLVDAYAARKFTSRSTVRTGDELETLGGSLEAMADSLVASEAALARHARIEQDLSRYLPHEIAESVARGDASLSLGGARREVTVLFADVASFTGFAESAPPEKVVAFLNELFTVLTEVVFRHGGMVDKFLGDCVMAVFGAGSAPMPVDDQVRHALEAAEDMHRFVEASAPAWKATYGLDVKLGIGVNLGEALVGNLGSETRMEYTVIGDAVNVAARLESLARGGQTLATGAVTRTAGSAFTFQPLGTHPLRGKRESVDIYEVML